ncbi:hypothetical protein EYF80_064387 [Liparis tanakae]|uniref:Uncharacterized protein n=1 Tax=Liparis tanakae TaxID=230148 RepID=A0A4Z2EB44_9TELE|nr:hypothetical protein EYF80_064387 [Liparis tanakae]
MGITNNNNNKQQQNNSVVRDVATPSHSDKARLSWPSGWNDLDWFSQLGNKQYEECNIVEGLLF